MRKVNLAEKLGQFAEHWSPRIVGELNGQHVKLVKLEGEFVWHQHEREDELFLVLEGHLEIHLRGSVVALDPGEGVCLPPDERSCSKFTVVGREMRRIRHADSKR